MHILGGTVFLTYYNKEKSSKYSKMSPLLSRQSLHWTSVTQFLGGVCGVGPRHGLQATWETISQYYAAGKPLPLHTLCLGFDETDPVFPSLLLLFLLSLLCKKMAPFGRLESWCIVLLAIVSEKSSLPLYLFDSSVETCRLYHVDLPPSTLWFF